MAKQKQGALVREFRAAIPTFECEPGCSACCGPVPASEWERKRLPVPDASVRSACYNGAQLSCPHLGPAGCTVYGERPLVCRLFGTVPALRCPKGRGPEQPLDPAIEKKILFFARTEKHQLL